MNADELAEQTAAWDATETAQRIANRDVSVEEVVAAAITRAKASQPRINAIVHPTYDRAAEQSKLPPQGVFSGVPTFIKDMEDLAGIPTRFGTVAIPAMQPRVTAKSVSEYMTTGVISLGKSTTAEFGLTGTTEPAFGNPTCNPIDPGHSPGGSSGGAAALVGAKVVPIAHGGDGGGSIRIPAAFCGLVGLKATRGRLAPMASTDRMPVKIATYGILTRSVRDHARFYGAIDRPQRGLAPIGDVEGPSQAKLRAGLFMDPPLGTPVHPDVRAAVEATAKILEAQGHSVEPMPPLYGQRLIDDFLLHWCVLAAGVVRIVSKTPGGDVNKLEPWTRDLADRAKRKLMSVPGAIFRLRRFRHHYAKHFERFDVILSPTTAGPAPALGHIGGHHGFEPHLERLLELLPYTPVQNASGAPAISVPVGTTKQEGLPIGVQLAAPWGEERRLLELAYLVEAEQG